MFLVGGPTEKVYLRKRKGFVREAIRNGAHLVPVYTFGNTSLFPCAASDGALARLSRRMRMSLVAFFPWPRRRPLLFVSGHPIRVKQQDNPSPEEVDKVHTLFIAALEELYERHRPDWENRRLEVV